MGLIYLFMMPVYHWNQQCVVSYENCVWIALIEHRYISLLHQHILKQQNFFGYNRMVNPVCWHTIYTPRSTFLSWLRVKVFLYRSEQTLRAPEFEVTRFSKLSAHACGKVVSRTHRPPLHPRRYPWYSFLLEAESTPGPQRGQKD